MNRTQIIATVATVLLFCIILLYRHFVSEKTDDKSRKNFKKNARCTTVAQANASLYSFFWFRSDENADRCFTFSFGPAEGDRNRKGHYLNCEFRAENGEYVGYTDVPITDECWNELESVLHDLVLPTYSPPDYCLLDAADSRIEICFTVNDDRITNYYSGENANEFHTFVMTLARRIADEKSEDGFDAIKQQSQKYIREEKK